MNSQSARTSSPIRLSLPLAAWTISVLVMTILVWFRPYSHTVYTIYAEAGRRWLHGVTAYVSTLHDSYRYGPTVTAFLAAFGSLPDAVGGVLWRWLGVALIVGGFAYACRTIYPHWTRSTATDRQWLWLLLLPLTIANLHNGQANLHMLGLLLIGVAAVKSDRWNLAAIALAAACLLKVYPISLALLLIAVFPLRLGPRFVLALVVGAALPFLAQSTGFVLDEYRAWFKIMAADDRIASAGQFGYRDLTLLLRNCQVPISREQFLIVEASTGVAAAVLCLFVRCRLGWSAEQLVSFVYAVGTFWMLVCGPTTESSTYVLAAPLAAWLVVDALRGRMSPVCAGLVLVGSGLIYFALFSSMFPFGRAVHDLGFQPLGALLMAVGYVADRFRSEVRPVPADG
jgi:hypothetical protein